MDWILIALAIIIIEVILVALLWENIAEFFASYSFLYEKGEKALHGGNQVKALSLFNKVANNLEFNNLPEEHPVKMAVYQHLATLNFELGQEQAAEGVADYGLKFFQDAIEYKIKELQLKGEWEQLQEHHPEIKLLRLNLAESYRQNNTNLLDAISIFFTYGHWEGYVNVYTQLKKQLAYANIPESERDLLEEKANLAREIIKYHQGVNKILHGDKAGKEEVDTSLEEIRSILNVYPDFLQVSDKAFDEIKEKLGLSVVEDLQALPDEELAVASEVAEEKSAEIDKKKHQGKEQAEYLPSNNWEVIVRQMRQHSRVINQIVERQGDIMIEVQTEWYLLPLIFQEEMVEKVSDTFYKLSRRKEGSVRFIFKDNKGREVARHTQLGVRIYQ